MLQKIKKYTCLSLCFISVCFTNQLRSQVNHVIEYVHWTELVSTIKFNDKFGLTADAQFRFVNAYQSQQYLLRIGPEIYVTKHFSLVPVGYCYVFNYAYEQNPNPYANNEHRIWSQMLYKHKVGRVVFQHRLRYEWRFNQRHSIDSAGTVIDEGYTSYHNRLRYRITVQIPIKNKNIEKKTWYIRAWNEFFLPFADPIANPTFIAEQNLQNRLFAGAGYQITKSISISFGFFYQMIMKRNGTYVEHNLGPYLSFNYNPAPIFPRPVKSE